ncbi:MAG: putative damage-inducible protein DinB [Candidatus Latescibacterota bacterium]|jgi:uncharacterized damage-inducible protein DinB
MKLIVSILALGLTFSNYAQQPTYKEAFLEKWENSRDYLVVMAEAMPAEHFGFKPTERQMSFEEQLMHIKENMAWLSTTYFTELEFERGDKTIPETKALVIVEITKAFNAAAVIIRNATPETFSDEVTFFSGPKSKMQIMNLMQDHVSHHRGQLVVYLNLNEIEPPRYVGW